MFSPNHLLTFFLLSCLLLASATQAGPTAHKIRQLEEQETEEKLLAELIPPEMLAEYVVEGSDGLGDLEEALHGEKRARFWKRAPQNSFWKRANFWKRGGGGLGNSAFWKRRVNFW